MVIIMVNYVKPFEIVDAVLEDHLKFLEGCYEQGKFICSGPQIPRDGAVILANTDLSEAREIIKKDPFYVNRIAKYQFVEFNPMKYDGRFACFIAK